MEHFYPYSYGRWIEKDLSKQNRSEFLYMVFRKAEHRKHRKRRE